MTIKKKVLGLGAVALLAVGLAACGSDKDDRRRYNWKFNGSSWQISRL